jgi:hypothetical protein
MILDLFAGWKSCTVTGAGQDCQAWPCAAEAGADVPASIASLYSDM